MRTSRVEYVPARERKGRNGAQCVSVRLPCAETLHAWWRKLSIESDGCDAPDCGSKGTLRLNIDLELVHSSHQENMCLDIMSGDRGWNQRSSDHLCVQGECIKRGRTLVLYSYSCQPQIFASSHCSTVDKSINTRKTRRKFWIDNSLLPSTWTISSGTNVKTEQETRNGWSVGTLLEGDILAGRNGLVLRPERPAYIPFDNLTDVKHGPMFVFHSWHIFSFGPVPGVKLVSRTHKYWLWWGE